MGIPVMQELISPGIVLSGTIPFSRGIPHEWQGELPHILCFAIGIIGLPAIMDLEPQSFDSSCVTGKGIAINHRWQ
jgi:hypothetical protein